MLRREVPLSPYVVITERSGHVALSCRGHGPPKPRGERAQELERPLGPSQEPAGKHDPPSRRLEPSQAVSGHPHPVPATPCPGLLPVAELPPRRAAQGHTCRASPPPTREPGFKILDETSDSHSPKGPHVLPEIRMGSSGGPHLLWLPPLGPHLCPLGRLSQAPGLPPLTFMSARSPSAPNGNPRPQPLPAELPPHPSSTFCGSLSRHVGYSRSAPRNLPLRAQSSPLLPRGPDR